MYNDPYFDIEATSNSDLKHFKRSPEHYQEYMKNGIKQTGAMAFGSAVHCLVLEPDNFKDQYIILDEAKRPEPKMNFGSTKNKEWKNEMLKDAKDNNKSILTSSDFEKAKIMTDKLYSNPASKELLEFSRNTYEATTEWTYKGKKCKGKIDIKNDIFLADLKTALSADEIEFSRAAGNLDYYRQAGMYLDGDAKGKLNFGECKTFYFIVIEKEPPYGVAVYAASTEFINRGIQEYRQLIDQLKVCEENNHWPSYDFKAIDMNGHFKLDLPYYLRD